MDIEITRHGLRITSTNQPMDDIVIEEVLGLYTEGDYVRLVRVSNKPVSLYVLETDPDICPVLAKTEAALTCDGTGEMIPPIDPTQPESLLPCPFCGAAPILIQKPGDPKGTYNKIACLNPQCPVQPEACDDRRVVEVDDRRVVGVEDPEACKAMLISLWNTRPTLV